MDEIVKNQWLEQDDRRISESIRRHGCCLEYVMPCDGDQFRTPFCYTIGLFGLGHPELLVYGLDQVSAAGLLNHLYRTVRDGRDLVPGELLKFDGHDEGYLVEQVPNPGEILFGANRHYQRPMKASVEALQLTWSANGFFHWDAGYPYRPSSQPRPGVFSALLDDEGDTGPCSCPRCLT